MLEQVQSTVVDRVTPWQDGATEGTEEELQQGFSEVGIEVSDDDATALAEAIRNRHDAIDARDVLGR